MTVHFVMYRYALSRGFFVVDVYQSLEYRIVS